MSVVVGIGDQLEKSNRPNLLPLHPITLEDEEFTIYEDEFDTVFKDDDCRNIALSGPYGAGKSSVIRKAEDNDKSKRSWITVSLAAFGETASLDSHSSEPEKIHNDSGEKQAEELEGARKEGDAEGKTRPLKDKSATKRAEGHTSSFDLDEVEAEVLRQIVHKVDLSNAPKSRLRKIKDDGWERDSVLAVFLIALFFLSCLVIPYLPSLMNGEALSQLAIIAMMSWVILAGIGVGFLLRRNMFSKMIKSFKFMDTELEIESDKDASPYERCVDEIVYLLNASEIDVVVFEDLDRFNSLAIFQRMRTLNILVNDSRKRKQPLRFFYLLRDGLFENPRDRTKFFDYIIPVIPCVDPSNALDKFDKALRGVGIVVERGFLFQLSAFFDDPRLINVIADEACHYKNALFGTRAFGEGDPERLVAMLAYKAMFPTDFESLQVGRGYMYEVLNGKERLLPQLEEKAATDLVAIDERLSEAKLDLDAAVKALAELDDDSPAEREEHLKNERDVKQRINALNEQRKLVDNKRASYQSMTIKQLIDESVSADRLFTFSEEEIQRPEDFSELEMEKVKRSPAFPMLRFLVVGGWVDESYRRYISNFSEDMLCATDDDFLSSIKQAKAVDMTYEPKAPTEIIRRMDPSMFARVNVRNPWLVAELLKGDYPSSYIEAFMQSVVRSGGLPYVVEFVNSEQFTPEIFEQVFKYFDNPVVDVMYSEIIEDDEKRAFCRKYIVEGGKPFSKESPDGEFAQIVNAEPLLLEEDARVQPQRLMEGLRHLGYKTEAIAHDQADRSLLQFVLDEKRFVADAEIVDGLMAFAYGKKGLLQGGTLISEVLELGSGPVYEVVNDDLTFFVESVVDACSDPLRDRADRVVEVLNNEVINRETGLAYIEKLSDVDIPILAAVADIECRKALVACGLAKLNTENIVSYFSDCDSSVNETLCKFINGGELPKDLTLKRVKELGADHLRLASGLIRADEMGVERIEAFLTQYGLVYSSFHVETLSDEKLGVLIRTRSIAMNANMLNAIRDCEVGCSLEYALTDIDGYLNLVLPDDDGARECDINEDEMLGIFDSDSVSYEKKLKLLSGYDGEVCLQHKYPEELQEAIVRNHFCDSDLDELPEYYTTSTESLQALIVDVLVSSIDNVMGEEVELGWPLASRVASHLKSNRNKSLQFADCYCGLFATKENRAEIRNLFASAGLPEYVKLIDGPSSMIPATELDDAMLETLYELSMRGAVSTVVNDRGLRRVSSKGYGKASLAELPSA